MKRIIMWVAFIFFMQLLLVTQVRADEDPIGWSNTGNFPTQTAVGSTYATTYTFVNNLGFTMPTPLFIAKLTASTEFSYADNCSGVKLANNQSCTVTVTYIPTSMGPKQLTLQIQYGKNVVPLPALTTTVTSEETLVIGAVTDGLPTNSCTDTPIATYTYPFEFTYTNVSSVTVTPSSVVVNFARDQDTCTGQPLLPNGSCMISGHFSSATPGTYQFNVSYNFTEAGVSKSVSLNTNTHAKKVGAACQTLYGQVILPPPANIYVYSDNLVKFRFRNVYSVASAQMINTHQVDVLYNKQSNFSGGIGTNHCSNVPLAPQEPCELYANFVPQSVPLHNTITFEARVHYTDQGGNKIAPASTTTTATLASTDREHIVFVNQCPFNVWYGMSNLNGIGSADPTSPALAKDYRLNVQHNRSRPATREVTSLNYNGFVWGRTNCIVDSAKQLTCESGSCLTNANTGTCLSTDYTTPQTGFPYTPPPFPNTPFFPYTQGMINWQSGNFNTIPAQPGGPITGAYGISNAFGTNIAVEIKGLGPYNKTATSGTGPFDCNAAGAVLQTPLPQLSTQLANAPWQFTPPSAVIWPQTSSPDQPLFYRQVNPGQADDNCSDTPGSCPTGQVCGIAYVDHNVTSSSDFSWNTHCGTLLGYWLPASFLYTGTPQFSTSSNDLSTFWQLYPTSLSIGPGPDGAYGVSRQTINFATFNDLYECLPTLTNSLLSGTTSALNQNVCGCINWDAQAPVTYSSQLCLATNTGLPPLVTSWISVVYPRISWMKNACPTCYAYPDDTATTQFSCTESAMPSYQIIFCPGGKTGREIT